MNNDLIGRPRKVLNKLLVQIWRSLINRKLLNSLKVMSQSLQEEAVEEVFTEEEAVIEDEAEEDHHSQNIEVLIMSKVTAMLMSNVIFVRSMVILNAVVE